MALTKASLDELCNWLEDPMLANQWVVTGINFKRLDGGPGVHLFEADYLRTYIETIDFPLPYYDVTDVHVQTSKVYFPGFNNVNAISITFYEDNKGTTLSKLLAWQAMMVKTAGNGTFLGYALPDEYKATINLRIHDGVKHDNGEPATSVSARIKGVWPSQIEPLALTGESERITIKATFSVDSVEIAVPTFK